VDAVTYWRVAVSAPVWLFSGFTEASAQPGLYFAPFECAPDVAMSDIKFWRKQWQ